jgi:hypothetical protein
MSKNMIHNTVKDFDLGDYRGCAGVSENIAPVIRSGAPGSWLCIDTIGADDELADPADLTLVLGAADVVLLVRNADDISRDAGAIAKNNKKVVVIEWRDGSLPDSTVNALVERCGLPTGRTVLRSK